MPRVRRPAPALTATALLRLVWLASPALPVGSFSYSEGLEAAVDSGAVTNEAQARAWLLDQLALVQQRAELPLLASAFKAWRRGDFERISVLNDWALHTRETQEFRQQTTQMGRSLADWLRQRWAGNAEMAPRLAHLATLAPAPAWTVASALAAVGSGAPMREALLALGFGWCEAMVQAALKAVPLGQAGGQRLLDALVAALPEAVDAAIATAAAGDGARQSFAPMLAVLSARHEAQYSRLFRS